MVHYLIKDIVRNVIDGSDSNNYIILFNHAVRHFLFAKPKQEIVDAKTINILFKLRSTDSSSEMNSKLELRKLKEQKAKKKIDHPLAKYPFSSMLLFRL